MQDSKRGKMEIRYPGMAPSPAQLEKIMKVAQEEGSEVDSEGGDVLPQYEIRTEDFPDGVQMGITPTLRNEVNQIIYSTHWEYQKRVLDHVDAACTTDRQWTSLRRILMGIMTEQVEKTRLLVSQRIRQELYKVTEPEESNNE